MDSGKARSRRVGGVFPLFAEKRECSPRPSATPLINEGGKIVGFRDKNTARKESCEKGFSQLSVMFSLPGK